ncbi:putative RTX toxin domain protein, partial [Vibrio parahaemolyticus EKP-008]
CWFRLKMASRPFHQQQTGTAQKP